MIVIKDTDVLKEAMCGFDSDLVEITTYIVYLYSKVVMTSGHRKGDSGVHGQLPCRGLDIRNWIYADPQAVVDNVNERWQYDPRRPGKMCAKLHKTPMGAFHIHLQTHPKTQRR